jgi:hypothetical protein
MASTTKESSPDRDRSESTGEKREMSPIDGGQPGPSKRLNTGGSSNDVEMDREKGQGSGHRSIYSAILATPCEVSDLMAAPIYVRPPPGDQPKHGLSRLVRIASKKHCANRSVLYRVGT